MTIGPAPKRSGNKRGFGSNLREEIIAAADRLLATSGSSEAVTLRAIAREAGIAAPSIYPHFPDRDAILNVVVGRTFDALAQTCRHAADAASPGIGEVEAMSVAYVQFAREQPGRYRILFERSAANIALPLHRYDEGITAFGLLLDAVGHARTGTASDDQPRIMLDAQTLFVALHGIATATAALPGFPWCDQSDLVHNAVIKIVGRTSER